MESTRPSPPPYQQLHPAPEEVVLNFQNLQHYVNDQDQSLLSQPNYQTFDVNWNTAKVLEGTRRKLRAIVNETEEIIDRLGRRQEFLTHKAKQAFDSVYTPEIRRRMYPDSRPPLSVPWSPPRFQPAEIIISPTAEIVEENPINDRQSPSPTTSVIRQNRMTRRCHQCRSRFHLKKNCPRYQCQKCFLFQPGHYTYECTNNETTNGRLSPSYDDHDLDGNLNRER
jgi:hypothetical protein